jgi:YtxH-like protein
VRARLFLALTYAKSAETRQVSGTEVGTKPEKRWTTGDIMIATCWMELADATPIGDTLAFNLEAFVNKFLKSLLKNGLDFLEESQRAGRTIRRQEDHTVRNAISFAAGIGVGIGVGMLFAPKSGEETRSSIAEKVQDAGARVRDRVSPAVRKPATSTEGK